MTSVSAGHIILIDSETIMDICPPIFIPGMSSNSGSILNKLKGSGENAHLFSGSTIFII